MSKVREVRMNNQEDLNNESFHTKSFLPSDIGTDYTFKRKIVWFNVIGFIILHLGAFYGIYLAIFEAKVGTFFYAMWMTFFSGIGVTAGTHRLWSHRTYKATLTWRIILGVLQTMAGQNCIYVWARDHRQHHKYSDTDADPHNAHRGFFFSHVGWLMSKKHPLVFAKGKKIDMSDLEADKVVMFQKKYYNALYVVFAIALPVWIPVYLWGETVWNSFYISYLVRYILLLHVTWSVNSWAHLFGTRPFDKNIMPVETFFVGFIALGEGWHNYHHAFPWDYKAGEWGSRFNMTQKIIELAARWGLAYDLKVASDKVIEGRIRRAGDGTHHTYKTADQMEKHDNGRVKKEILFKG